MADKVAVHRIIIGIDEEQKVIEPGTRFNTDEYQIDAEQLERWENTGVVREPRDQAKEEDNPMKESEEGRVVEGRSGPARDVTNPSEGELRGEKGRVLEPPRDARPADQREPVAQRPPAPEAPPERRGRRSDTDL